MDIGQITLLKKISPGYVDLGSKAKKKYFTAIGNFQYMSFKEYTEIKDFPRIVKYPSSEEIDGARYAMFPIFFYNAFRGEKGYEKTPFHKDDRKNKYFTVSTLKLNKSKSLAASFHDAATMLRSVKEAIDECIKKNLYADDDCPVVQIYPCLGAVDFVVIANSEKLDGLMNIWTILRSIPIPGCTGELLFRSSNSFVAVHNTFDLNNATRAHISSGSNQGRELSVEISHSLSGLSSCEGFQSAYKRYFEDAHIKGYNVQGENDVSIFIDNCRLDKLLYLLGVRDNAARDMPEYLSSVSELDEYYGDIVESNHVHLFFGNSPTGTLEPCTINNQSDDKIDEIKRLRVEIKGLLPVSAERTLDFLIDKCIGVLSVKSRYVNGSRMYFWLHNIMQVIRDNTEGFDGDSISLCLGNISSMINLILMADNLRIDRFGSSDLETINSGAKIFYATENIIRKMLSFLNAGKNTPQFFITINPLMKLRSSLYLQYAENKKDGDICSINLPNVGYFAHSFPHLAHEISHYVYLSDELNAKNNKVLIDLLNHYIQVDIWDYINPMQYNVSEEVFVEFFNNLIAEAKYELDFTEISRIFKRQCIKYVATMSKELERVSNKTTQKQLYESTDSPDTRVFIKLCCNGLKALSKNQKDVSTFLDVVEESQADIITTVICNQDYRCYLESNFRFMLENKIPFGQYDNPFSLRAAAVLDVLTRGDGGVDLVHRYRREGNISNDERECLKTVLDYWDNNTTIVGILADYLYDVRSCAIKKLLNENTDDTIKATLRLFRASMLSETESIVQNDANINLINLAETIYNEWYEGLRYWGRQ